MGSWVLQAGGAGRGRGYNPQEGRAGPGTGGAEGAALGGLGLGWVGRVLKRRYVVRAVLRWL